MAITDPSGGCWPTELQELLLKACLFEGDRALEAWHLWESRAGFDRLDQGSYRLLPLLYANLSRLGVQHPMLAKLKGIHRRAWSQTRTLTWKLSRAVQLLEDHGVPTLLLKGAPLAALFYRDAGLRPMHDLDILVTEEHAVTALALLQSNGWRSKGEQPLGKKQVKFQSSIELFDSDLREIDIHWHVLHLAGFSGADTPFWEAAIPFTFEGIVTRTLCPTDHLLHACEHGVRWNGVSPVRWVADSALIMRSARIDWNRLVGLTDVLHAALPVSSALHYLASVLELPVPPEVLQQLALLKVTRTEQLDYERLQSEPLQGPTEWIRLRYAIYAQRTRGRSLNYKIRVVGGWSLVRLSRLLRSNLLGKDRGRTLP